MFALLIFGNRSPWTPLEIGVGLFCLSILLAFGFAGEGISTRICRLPLPLRLLIPETLALPYLLVSLAEGLFHLRWLALYLLLPVGVAFVLWLGSRADPGQKGTWSDYLVLLGLGLAVDLRWFEAAWPSHLHSIGKIVLLDAGLYGFVSIRGLSGCGIDFRLCRLDAITGLRELLFYTPIAIPLGLWLGFLHVHRFSIPWWIPLAWLYTALFIAIPEEIFFRAWMQNLLQRRMRKGAALLVTSVIFGLSHFNKRAIHFNWQYVLMATIAGIFYGRAWLAERRVAASAITHASVDTLWSIWLR